MTQVKETTLHVKMDSELSKAVARYARENGLKKQFLIAEMLREGLAKRSKSVNICAQCGQGMKPGDIMKEIDGVDVCLGCWNMNEHSKRRDK